jgi:type IV pilus assembly protein PilM
MALPQRLPLLGRKPFLTGLDIGSHSIKLVRLRARQGGYQIVNFGVMPLPARAIVDHTIMDQDSVVAAIRNLLRMEKISVKGTAIALSSQAAVIKTLRLPRMSNRELAEAMHWEAEPHIPFDMADVNLDFRVLTPARAAGGQMDVLLVAARKASVSDRTHLLTAAGLRPVVVDIDALALANSFEAAHGLTELPIALVDIGASTMTVNLVANGVTMFQRAVATGGNRYTAAVQNAFGVDPDEAEAMILGHGHLHAAQREALVDILAAISTEIGSELQRSFEFFRTTSNLGVERVVISGGCARIKGLDRFLDAYLELPVSVANPFARLVCDDSQFDAAYLQDMAPLAAIAAGLALRRRGDQ